MALTGSSYSLKWHGHGVHLNSSIAGLYRCDNFTDAMLATSDGQCIAAHQFVLSACSPYLHKMFMVGSNGSRNSSKVVVILPSEISYATLSILLQYIYKGEAIVNREELPSIMKAAGLLQVRGLYPGKDKQDIISNGNRILKQQIKNNSELKNDSEAIKTGHKGLIPELKINSEYVNGSVNYCPTSLNNKMSRSSPSARKNQRSERDKPASEHKNEDSRSSLENMTAVEKVIEEEDIEIKEEPIDLIEEKSVGENIIKQEEVSEEEIEIEDDNCYVPLTCDFCHKTFTTPALWVRHIEQNHPSTALASGKRNSLEDSSGGEYPPLHCEMCQKIFLVPAEWVRHVQTHTEQQLAKSNDPPDRMGQASRGHVECNVCGKVLQSQASMQIHSRTHTGERPFPCKLCGQKFNVKSNYLRHLRGLHNQVVNTTSSD